MLEHLFRFPIVMIDGDNEARKIRNQQKYGDLPGDPEEEDYDIIFGEAEYPYWEFIGIEDRWLPKRESIEKAMNDGVFDACIVRFVNAGQMLVPWPKKKFKASIMKFMQEYKKNNPEEPQQAVLRVKTISADEYKRITEDGKTE